MIPDEIRGFFRTLPKGRTYLAEAEFGLRHVTPYLGDLPAGARVLEVGSGPCIALSSIVAAYPHLHVEGIEPTGEGFAFFKSFIEKVQAGSPGFAVHRGGYEDFPESGAWDLIFLVNVFEHLRDWRHFLRFAADNLSGAGRCIILCPNYGFPYESHFGLPVMGGKEMTRRLFQRRIDRMERDEDCAGLYSSLNFVKLAQVRRAAQAVGLDLKVHTGIVSEMIDRLDTDAEFARRQKAIAYLARLIKRSGMLDWMLGVKGLQNILPYMKLELTR